MLRIVLLLVVLIVPLSAVVVSGGDTNNDWWREGQTAPWSFGVLDGDGDGKISAAEFSAAQKQFATALKETKSSLLAAIDADHSGKVSRYEAAEGMPRWVSLRERAREMVVAASDQDGDGKLNEDESFTLEKRIGTVFVRYGTAGVDANKDQNFSRPEVQAALRAIREGKGKLFTLCDRNNDGQVSVQEANLAFDILAAAVGL
jgi:Ca2+-binding EF-hand superfamily protein